MNTTTEAVAGDSKACRVIKLKAAWIRNTAAQIRVGDVVMPPERELRLWMRRHVREHNLPESALHLHVEEIKSTHDKGGEWVIVKARYDKTWDARQFTFTFKARPETPWSILDAYQNV